MPGLIKSWLIGNAARLLGFVIAAVSVSAVVLGIRQTGRNAERLDNLKKILEIKDAQLHATLDAPRTRAELVDRLRRGKF